MNSLIRPVLSLGLCALLATGAALAADPVDPNVQRIRNNLAVFLPDLKIDHIGPSAVDGLYEVVFDSRLLYITADGRYIVQGSVFDVEAQRNITKPRLIELRLAAVDAMGEDNMLIYEPAETRHQVTVFTDIDCVYCRRLHRQMNGYLKHGIRIRYLFYPRSGKDTPSYDKAVSVWCAKDRHQAMDAAKSGGNLTKASCANPVDAHMALGEQLGIRGTPALVLDNGAIVPSYLTPDELLRKIEEKDNNN